MMWDGRSWGRAEHKLAYFIFRDVQAEALHGENRHGRLFDYVNLGGPSDTYKLVLAHRFPVGPGMEPWEAIVRLGGAL